MIDEFGKLVETASKPPRELTRITPKEFRVVALRECPTPEQMQQCDTPDKADAYWRLHIPADPRFDPELECFVVLFLNTRRRIRGHSLISIGTHDCILVHPTSVFRCAVAQLAEALILMHNHPSGDPTPSDADIKVTRDLIRAGQILKIEVLDHVVVGRGEKPYVSLRECGYLS